MDKPTKNKNLQTANDKELRPFRERKVSSQVFWQLLRQGHFVKLTGCHATSCPIEYSGVVLLTISWGWIMQPIRATGGWELAG